MEIEYYIKSVYGTDLIYVKEPLLAKAFETLTKKKTIDKKDMYALGEFGLTFKQALPN